MITITKNTVNTIALTLTEKSTLQNSDWILVLINDVVGIPSQKVIALRDISTPPSRTNIFEITESPYEDLMNSVVSLDPTGQWTYKAYEMIPASPRELDPSKAVKEVELGRCLVVDPDETVNNFFDDDQHKNTPVFEG